MKTHEVDEVLRQRLVTEDQRLVFWRDAEGELAECSASGLSHERGGRIAARCRAARRLAMKRRLETEDTVGEYLVYSQGQRPQAELDWLLDTHLYSSEFYADIASLWLQELGAQWAVPPRPPRGPRGLSGRSRPASDQEP